MKKQKCNIIISEWKNGKIHIFDIQADSLEEAKKYIETLVGDDVTVKVYDKNKRLQYSAKVKNKGKGHYEHGKGLGKGHEHHDDDFYA